MQDGLQCIYEYRLLVGKRDALAIPLTESESERLQLLEAALPAGIPTVDERNRATRLSAPLPVRLMFRGQLVVGSLRNASRQGLAMALDEPPGLGEVGVVHVSEPLHGIDYSFPGRVVARVLRGTIAIGWAFVGVPSQVRQGNRSSGVWHSEDKAASLAPTRLAGSRR
ncbi:MAG: PilZ domain-containing protein [Myxococcales bacterium]|nr:PilZ domain-containing protein [Myxococcales bacterium]